jgi:purine-binding chemotaxis protein CheW
VITLAPEQLRPAPEFSSDLETAYILGLGTLGERMLILMDIERLMGSREMGLMEPAAVH